MASTVQNPRLPVHAQDRAGSDYALNDPNNAGGTGPQTVTITNEDGNDLLINPAVNYTARVRLVDGSVAYLRNTGS